MLDSILTILSFKEALLAGCLVAVICSLLGVMVILKRVVFIGITLSEVAAAGIAGSLMLGVAPPLGAIVLTLAVVSVLACPFENRRVPRDAVLGFFFVLAAAGSILIVSQSGFGLAEIRGLLYGDLVLTTQPDLIVLVATMAPVAAFITVGFRPLLYTFLDRDAARVLGVGVAFWELAFFYALGLAVAASSKLAGVLLVFAYLAVAPAAALLLTRRLGRALILAAALALAATLGGIVVAFHYDLPTNQTISVAACAIFAAAAVYRGVAAFAAAVRPTQ